MNIEAELTKLSVKPGDILMLKPKRQFSDLEMLSLSDIAYRFDIRFLVVPDGVSLEVMSEDDLARIGLARIDQPSVSPAFGTDDAARQVLPFSD